MTIPQAYRSAVQHQQAGQLAEAEALCRSVLAVAPRHADALQLLGVIALQRGGSEAAADLFRQAIALEPEAAEFHSNLGEAHRAQRQFAEAVAAYREAISLKPGLPQAHYNLGLALAGQGHWPEAISAYREAIALRANYPKAYLNLGNALRGAGRLEEAIGAYEQALAFDPGFSEAQLNLGNVWRDQGKVELAIGAYRRALALKPDFAEAWNNLGNALRHRGGWEETVAAFRQALALRPNFPEALVNLGAALRDQGKPEEAADACRRAIGLQPDFAEAHFHLGNALGDQGLLSEAIEEYRQATALKSDYPEAKHNLGNALKDAGQLDEAVAAYRGAIALNPAYAEAHSNLVYALHFHGGYDAAALRRELARWNLQHAGPWPASLEPHGNDRSPGRRLRVGYVSPNFCAHVIGANLLPLLTHHRHEDFEIFCYAQVLHSDALTARFKSCADHWHNTVGLTDEQLAARIREDQIDILVDLTLHLGHNRLLVFARQPAPVQVTFAGYPGSTGLETIGYRFSDPHLDPPETEASNYSEQTIRLPHSFWCYEPLEGRALSVNELPAESNGFVTFGCLNNFCKINEAGLRLWARVLQAVPLSRLLLLAPEGRPRAQTLELLGREGIDSGRVEFASFLPRPQYLELYRRIDVGLDTLPYNGHTTSLDSYWMGVPVVTLAGQTVVGRAGVSQSMNLQLPELIADSPERFVRIAAGLAADLPSLARLRGTLRQRMEDSPLMDAPGFTGGIEAAYRSIWQRWCFAEKPAPQRRSESSAGLGRGGRTAILVSGQCRTLDLCFPNLAAQVLRFFPGADLWVSVAAGPDAAQAQLFHGAGLRVRLLEEMEPPELDERDYRARSAGGTCVIGEGPDDPTAVQRILLQAWRLRRVYEQALGSGENYDTFVRLRPDQWFLVGLAGLPSITAQTAALPWWGSFDGVNDRFAVLGKAAAEAYCWWPRLDEHLAEGCRFHPETLTRHALTRAGCRIVHLPALAATLKRDAAGGVIVREPEVLPHELTPVPQSF